MNAQERRKSLDLRNSVATCRPDGQNSRCYVDAATASCRSLDVVVRCGASASGTSVRTLLTLCLIAVSGPVGRYPMEPSSPRSPETSGPRRVCGENRNTLTGKTRSADRGSDMPLEHAQWLRRPGLRPKLPKPAMRGACTGVDHGPASPDRLHQHPQACSGLQGTPQVWPSTTSVARTLLMPTPQPRLTLQVPQLHAEQTAAWHEPDRSQDRVRRHGARSRYLPPACPPTCRSCRRSRMRNLRGDPMPRPAW